MSEKKFRVSILDSISDWLKLLGLIILVAEGVILLAMKMTPSSYEITKWYPLAMLLFLLFIVIGVFADRVLQRKSANDLSIALSDYKLTVDTSKPQTRKKQSEEIKNIFIDSRFGFSCNKPQSIGWKEPEYLDLQQYQSKLGILDVGIDWEDYKNKLSISPFGNMMKSSTTVSFQYGEVVNLQFTNDTTTNAVEDHIMKLSEYHKESSGEEMSEADISEARQSLMHGEDKIEKVNFANSFLVQVWDKKLSLGYSTKVSLSNMFQVISAGTGEPLYDLTSNKDSILWVTNHTFKHVRVSNELREFTIYRMYRLLENSKNFFLLQVQWTPQSEAVIDIWEELKKCFESFRILASEDQGQA